MSPRGQNSLPIDHHSPVIDGGSFTITHISHEAGGFDVAVNGIGRTALLPSGLNLSSTEKAQVRDTVWSEMKFSKLGLLGDVAELRVQAHAAEETGNITGANDLRKQIESIRSSNEYTTQRSRACSGLGKKIGLRNLSLDPSEPNRLTGRAQFVPFYMYNRFSNPENHGEALGHISEAAGVAMALVTADGRLVVQHRAIAKRDLSDGKIRPGNASYNDIPGASVAGMIDASVRSTRDKNGTPKDVTTESLTQNILKEAGEELGLAPSSLAHSRIVGIAHDNIKPHDEVLFLAKTDLTFAGVRKHSESSNKNKNLRPEDLEEKFFDIEASPEAIQKLLTEVRCPLPPTHAAAYLACGYNLMLERGDSDKANAWLAEVQSGVTQNYAQMDAMVADYYMTYPGASSVVPERMWNQKHIPLRNLTGYTPTYGPSEQGLPELQDELVRTGLAAETRTPIAKAKLFDVDGVLTNPSTKELGDPAILQELAACLKGGEAIALNTGRSVEWLRRRILQPLQEQLDDPSDLQNFFAVGEKGGAWLTFDKEGSPIHGKIPDLAMPDELKQRVQALVAEKFGDAMFFDLTKETMISIEMHDGYNVEAFAPRQAELVNELRKLLDEFGLTEQYHIDPTTIATDVESPHMGKALGVDRFIEFLKERGIAYSTASFVAYGDSRSDADMAEELSRKGLQTAFVYVGDPSQLDQNPAKNYTLVTPLGRYEQGVLDHVSKSSVNS